MKLHRLRSSVLIVVLTALSCLESTRGFLQPTPSVRLSRPRRVFRSPKLFKNEQLVETTTIAGNLWPKLSKLYVTPAKAKEVVTNVVKITNVREMALLMLLAFGAVPLAKLTLSEDDEALLSPHKRLAISTFISEFGKVGLSVYLVDVLCVVLGTLGFNFLLNWHVSAVYAKLVYTWWIVRHGLRLKTRALCRINQLDPEDMGRFEILDRLLNGVVIAIAALVLFDWLSVQMGVAVKSVLAFGSVGTLAFTLGSQKLVAQLVSGIALNLSNKMYVGDNVAFGDGTSGKVIKMGWMETVLRGGDNIVTSVPNSILSGQKISNKSRLVTSQVKQTLRFHYEDADQLPDLLDTIKSEIKEACPLLISDGTRPFRVFWTDYKEGHLEVMIDTHFNIAPLGDAYWHNRMNVLKAINRAVNKHNMEFAKLHEYENVSGEEPQWRVARKSESKKGEGTNGEDAGETS